MSARRKNVTDSELLALHKSGKSARAIAAVLKRRGTPLGKSAIDERLERLARRGAPVRGKTKRTPNRAKVSTSSSAERALEAPPDEGDDIEATRRRLRKVRALIDANEKGALSGEVAMGSFGALCRLEADLVDRVLSQIPPTPTAPADDPTNQAEADACLRRLAAAVAAAEESARCAHCGRRPF